MSSLRDPSQWRYDANKIRRHEEAGRFPWDQRFESPIVLNTLKEWKLACPKTELDLVFPNGAGNFERLQNLTNRFWQPLQRKAGLVDESGEPLFDLHALRHFAASVRIEAGFSPKRLQALLDRSSIQMTFDRCGHSFPDVEDDHAKFARIEREIGLVA